jgi:hypothetical protein
MRARHYSCLIGFIALSPLLGGCEGIRESLGMGKHPPDEFQVVSRAPLSIPPDFNLRPPEPGAPRPQEGTPRDQAQSAVFNSASQGEPSDPLAPVATAAPTVPVEEAESIDDIPTLATMGAPDWGDAGEPAQGTAPEPASAPASAPAPAASPAPAAAGTSAGESALLQRSGASGVDPSIRRTVELETNEIIESDTRFIDRLIFWQDRPEPGLVIDPAKEQQRLQENAALGKPVTEGETPVIERRRRAFLEGIF